MARSHAGCSLLVPSGAWGELNLGWGQGSSAVISGPQQQLLADQLSPGAPLNATLYYSLPEYFIVSFLLSFFFYKMKLELGSKLCELLLAVSAESHGCMHPADP